MNELLKDLIAGISEVDSIEDITALEHMLFAQKTLLEERQMHADRIKDLKCDLQDLVSDYGLTNNQLFIFFDRNEEMLAKTEKLIEQGQLEEAEELIESIRYNKDNVDVTEFLRKPAYKEAVKSYNMLLDMKVEHELLESVGYHIEREEYEVAILNLNDIQQDLF